MELTGFKNQVDIIIGHFFFFFFFFFFLINSVLSGAGMSISAQPFSSATATMAPPPQNLHSNEIKQFCLIYSFRYGYYVGYLSKANSVATGTSLAP